MGTNYLTPPLILGGSSIFYNGHQPFKPPAVRIHSYGSLANQKNNLRPLPHLALINNGDHPELGVPRRYFSITQI